MSEDSPGVRDPSRAADDELIEMARQGAGPRAEACLDELYRRYYPRVARWALKLCRDREEAADLAQEIFLRVHTRLEAFRGDSRFSTWLYTVVRSVAINRGVAARRRIARTVSEAEVGDPADPSPGVAGVVETDQELERLRIAMARDLEPTEARVMYLHYVAGLTLPAITGLLGLDNKSGAKAFVVSAKRKLRRSLGDARRRAASQPGGGS